MSESSSTMTREPCSLRHVFVESNNALHAITNTAILFFVIVSFISLFAFSVASTDWGEINTIKQRPLISIVVLFSLGLKSPVSV